MGKAVMYNDYGSDNPLSDYFSLLFNKNCNRSRYEKGVEACSKTCNPIEREELYI